MVKKSKNPTYVYRYRPSKKFDDIGYIENDATQDGGKNRQQIMADIIDYTNNRIDKNQRRLIELFNA